MRTNLPSQGSARCESCKTQQQEAPTFLLSVRHSAAMPAVSPRSSPTLSPTTKPLQSAIRYRGGFPGCNKRYASTDGACQPLGSCRCRQKKLPGKAPWSECWRGTWARLRAAWHVQALGAAIPPPPPLGGPTAPPAQRVNLSPMLHPDYPKLTKMRAAHFRLAGVRKHARKTHLAWLKSVDESAGNRDRHLESKPSTYCFKEEGPSRTMGCAMTSTRSRRRCSCLRSSRRRSAPR